MHLIALALTKVYITDKNWDRVKSYKIIKFSQYRDYNIDLLKNSMTYLLLL